MKTQEGSGVGIRIAGLLNKFLEHRHLPAILAMGAVLVMLPALKIGLGLDDLPERAVALRPDQLPLRMDQTGNPADSGSFRTVLRAFFLNRSPEEMALARNYGALPWWAPDNLKIGLLRPITAFTHWLDYQLYPNSPALMHAHNIAWFVAVVFVVTVIYRKLMGAGWSAGLAALLWLLDGSTYFPVAFVGNRGFLIALLFGLLCLYEHHRWRSTKSRSALALSAVFFALSLISEENGAATLAFILAYAVALEPGSFRSRALTVLPAILVMGAWLALYEGLGFGLRGLELYVDPVRHPLQFAWKIMPRMLVVLGGQLANVPADLLLEASPSLQPKLIALFGVAAAVVVVVFLPWLLRDKMAAFWFAVMMLAAIPASAFVPLSKNFGFVAVGAYGLIASFVGGLVSRANRFPEWPAYRALAWTASVLLLLAHVPGAIAERVGAANVTPRIYYAITRLADFGDLPDAEHKSLVLVNLPSPCLVMYVPGCKAFFHQPLPKTLRALAPGCITLDVQRTDDKTLVIQSRGPDLFSCDDMGPMHPAYAISTCNTAAGGIKLGKGHCTELPGLKVEVQEASKEGIPSRVAFRFDTSLDSPEFHWLWFNWLTVSNEPFHLPAIGQSVTLPGPSCRADLQEKKLK
jgi:hypothetical protein